MQFYSNWFFCLLDCLHDLWLLFVIMSSVVLHCASDNKTFFYKINLKHTDLGLNFFLTISYRLYHTWLLKINYPMVKINGIFTSTTCLLCFIYAAFQQHKRKRVGWEVVWNLTLSCLDWNPTLWLQKNNPHHSFQIFPIAYSTLLDTWFTSDQCFL